MPRLFRSPRTRVMLTAAVALSITAGIIVLTARNMRQPPVALTLPTLPAAALNGTPTRVLWAWEEPEDLRTLPTNVGVAYLAETYLLTDHVAVLPRRQPLSPAPGAALIAVVRIETRPGFADTPELRATVASHLALYGGRGDIRALQIDFDATESQQPFYRGVLEALRPQLPRSLPLSITALVSWCGPHSWLHTLPIDEAVPMEFRMGGPRALAFTRTARPLSPIPYPITEPLCRTSLGLSTDEPWPASLFALNPSTRVYLFAPRPWRAAEFAAISTAPLTLLARELAR